MRVADYKERTAVQHAAERDHTHVVEYLLSLGGIHMQGAEDNTGLTTFHLAVLSGSLDTIKYLVSLGLNPTTTTAFSRESAIHVAARGGQLDVL